MSVLDRTKVIKGLGEALTLLAEYVPGERYLGYAPGACLDAIELLKAQEPIVPIRCSAHAHGSDDVWYECGKCGEFLGVNRYSKQFCAKCGRAVKWE